MADDGEMSGKITEDGIQRYRNRIGVLARREAPYNYEATEDSIRQYAVYACGDDNPLFTDPSYAAETRWGGVIAPPAYVQTMGIFQQRADSEGGARCRSRRALRRPELQRG